MWRLTRAPAQGSCCCVSKPYSARARQWLNPTCSALRPRSRMAASYSRVESARSASPTARAAAGVRHPVARSSMTRSPSFSATASMPDARVGHAASLDGSGRVLIVGGAQLVRLSGEHSVDLGDAGLRDSSLLFDPATERWTEVETLWGQRLSHLTLLNDGSLITAGGFADRGRIHSDVLRLSVTEDSVRLVETAEAMRCPRVGHQAFRYLDEVVLWGGSRCTDSDQSAPEIWSPRAGLRLADTERWGSEANLSFATSVELLQTGTFLIAGGSVYRDGSLQTPNRENSYYFLAETETHVRAVMLPEGILHSSPRRCD